MVVRELLGGFGEEIHGYFRCLLSVQGAAQQKARLWITRALLAQSRRDLRSEFKVFRGGANLETQAQHVRMVAESGSYMIEFVIRLSPIPETQPSLAGFDVAPILNRESH